MKILVAGDFAPRNRISSLLEKKNFGFMDEVLPMIKLSDYSIINFESPVVIREALPLAKAGPHIKCTAKAMECLKMVGFTCVTLANNHFRDYGQIGVEDTIDTCVNYGIEYVGGGKDQNEAQRILYKNIQGKVLAIINVCENEFSICSDSYGGSNSLNPVRNYYAIREAREKADYVLVIVHGGVEGYQFPTPRMQETYRFFVDSGADAVVNHHQHCFSGYEVYQGKPIFYGLGNFCFDKANSNALWQNGFFISIDFGAEITFTLYPYLQGSEYEAGISLLKDKTLFDEKLISINKIISSPLSLQKQFDELIQNTRDSRLLNMEPIYNKYIRFLQRKGLLPRLLKGKSLLDTFVRLNCETHREILIKILTQEIDKQE